MRILVFERDPQAHELWFSTKDYEVTAETESAYQVRVFWFFRKWVPKNAIGMRCENVYGRQDV